eukprot:662975-Pelagomonas_calceolata.AAC.5
MLPAISGAQTRKTDVVGRVCTEPLASIFLSLGGKGACHTRSKPSAQTQQLLRARATQTLEGFAKVSKAARRQFCGLYRAFHSPRSHPTVVYSKMNSVGLGQPRDHIA